MAIFIFLVTICILHVAGTQGAQYGSGSFHQQQSGIQVKIGGLFDSVDSLEEATLKLAVEQINRDPTLLPFHHLSVKAETVEGDNSFNTAKAVCSLLSEGIVGLFGPQNSDGAAHAQSLCDRYDVPHIETRWDYRTRQNMYAINLYPHPDTLGQAYTNLVDKLGWGNFSILYDNDEGLFKLQDLIRTSMQHNRNITVRQLPTDHDFRTLLKIVQREYEIKNIIIDTGIEKTLEVLRQAEQIGMTRFDYSYILTTLDLQPDDMDEYQYGDAQFFAYRMVDPENPIVQAITQELTQTVGGGDIYRNSRQNQFEVDKTPQMRSSLTTAQALIFDAVRLFSKALDENSEMIGRVEGLNCNQNEGWTEGSTLLNDMRAMTTFDGLTGAVQFNNSGFRTDVSLDLVKVIKKKGFVKTGTWDYARFANSRIHMVPPTEDELVPTEPPLPDADIPLAGRHIRIVTILNPPFCMYKQAQEPMEHNARYEGYSIDLVEELSKVLHFNYTIDPIETGPYDDMIKEVKTYGEIVVADLTVTKDRQKDVDFTMPFMNLGIAILFVPPQPKPPRLFSFMSPFALEVWIYVGFAFFGVSLVLFIVARVTPLEWDNPLPCITDPDKLQNQFKFSNSIWFTLGSIMQQGSDLAPKAVSTRIIAGIWWFFTLIMVSSYTANLATFLIVQELEETIKSLSDLAAHKTIQYGCYKSGSTSKFFSNTTEVEKLAMWHKMSVWPDALKMSNDEGISAVLQKPGTYAFFIESTLIEYNMERKCGLAQVGGLLDNKGYGIAHKKDSPYRNALNGAILSFQESGKLDDLKRKWWKEERKEAAQTCQQASVSDTVKPLQLSNVGGVFVVLVVGCCASIFITCLEILLNSRAVRRDLHEDSRIREILKDLQFALQCRGNVKPVQKKSRQSLANSKEELGSTPFIKYASNKSLAD